MTIKKSVKGDFQRIKARFTDNIRQERIPITDVTINHGTYESVMDLWCHKIWRHPD